MVLPSTSTAVGRGGRSQELALSASVRLRGLAGILLLAGGTDGTDGPTDAAGGLVDGATADRIEAATGVSIEAALARHDSYTALQAAGRPIHVAVDEDPGVSPGEEDDGGALLITGPTGTNVMDLCVILAT